MPFLSLIFLAVATTTPAQRDQAEVAALDTAFQAAVKANDAETMAKILADDYVLVLGDGSTQSKANLLVEAREKHRHYEQQDELEQHVRPAAS